MSTAITNLHIQISKSSGPTEEGNWTFLVEDLNRSVGGDFLYLGYECDPDDPPITSLTFKAYDKKQTKNPEAKGGWRWCATDLNRGAGGKFIYMFWKVGEPGRAPIINLLVRPTTESKPKKIDGYTQTGCDLNKGAGGEYIWAYYSTVIAPGTRGDRAKVLASKSSRRAGGAPSGIASVAESSP